MNMPGFSAEFSLHQRSERYHAAVVGNLTPAAHLLPQQIDIRDHGPFFPEETLLDLGENEDGYRLVDCKGDQTLLSYRFVLTVRLISK